MPSFKKVLERGNGTADLNEDQKEYEKKVVKLEKACEEFNSKFKKVLNTPAEWKKTFDDSFKDQMKKNRLTSRTIRILNGISKNLSKFKGNFDPQKINDYVKAFGFTPEKAKNGYIKRSAIDDKTIANVFNFDIPTILMKNSNELKVQEAYKGNLGNVIQRPLKNGEKALEDVEEKLKMIDKDIEHYSEVLKKTSKTLTSDGYLAAEVAVEKLKSIKNDLINSKNKVEESKEKLKQVVEPKSVSNAGAGVPAKNGVQAKNVVKELEGAIAECYNKMKNKIDFRETDKQINEWKENHKDRKIIKFESEKDFEKIGSYDDDGYDKSDIVEVVIGDKIQKISDKAFMGCDNLVSIRLGKACNAIGESAFSGCKKLVTINTSRVTIIGNSAFSGCKVLEQVDLRRAEKIGNYAFYECTSLIGTRLGQIKILNTEKLTAIGNDAFNGCKNLIGIDLGSIQKIGDRAFNDCKNIKTVVVPKEQGEHKSKVKNTVLTQCDKKYNTSEKDDYTIVKGAKALWGRLKRAASVGKINFVDSTK